MTEEIADRKETTEAKPRGWGTVLVWVLVIGFLVLIGLGLFRSQQGPIGVGTKVPDFTLITFDGEEIPIGELRGQVVVINFWASWCKPCEQEAAELEQAYQMFKDQEVMFLGVDYVDTEPEALGYLEKFQVTYPNGPDLGTKISQAFRIRGVPETYLINREGVLAYVKIGPFESIDEIVNAVRSVDQE
jgi:cytochrome c biogenesis protein CcmG/thiol:disulfide interchange protein DsbE